MQLPVGLCFVMNESTELSNYEGQTQPEMLHVNSYSSVTKKSFSKLETINSFKPESYETDTPLIIFLYNLMAIPSTFSTQLVVITMNHILKVKQFLSNIKWLNN
jgi:hypothetical protein